MRPRHARASGHLPEGGNDVGLEEMRRMAAALAAKAARRLARARL
jgi:hypothetical protein